MTESCSHGTITYRWAEFLVMKIVVRQDKNVKNSQYVSSCPAVLLLVLVFTSPNYFLHFFDTDFVWKRFMKWDCTMRKRTALPLNNIGLPHHEPYLWLISHTKVKCVAHSFFNLFKEWLMPPHARPVRLDPILRPWHDECSLKMVELYRRCVPMGRMSDGVQWMKSCLSWTW